MNAILSKFVRKVGIGLAGAAACAGVALAADKSDGRRDFDRVLVIMMENHGFDNIIGRLSSAGTPLTPFITDLALKSGLGTYYFGVTHPSLPNYLATIAGDFFGVQDDQPSCFASDLKTGQACHRFDGPNLVDQLEKKGISWETLQESVPGVGFLGQQFPPSGPQLYAQKHNPFPYFTDIATNPARLQKIKPFDLTALKTELSHPATASRFIYISPNQCNDQHGLALASTVPVCNTDEITIALGDKFLSQTVPTIVNSPSFTERSALFIIWDENDFSTSLGCCGQPGGGHVPTIVVTKNSKPVRSSVAMSHYSLLATIEDGFDLPRLGNARTAETMFSLFPDSDD